MESLTAGMVQMKNTVRLCAMKVPNRLKGVLGVTEFNLFISNIDFNGFSLQGCILKMIACMLRFKVGF